MLAVPTPPVPKPVTTPQSYTSEVRNTLTTPANSELLLSEGAYVERDEIALGAVSAHPNYPQNTSNNLLDTRPLLPTTPPVLSTTSRPPVKDDTQFDDTFQLASPSRPQPISKASSSTRFKYLATGNLKAYVGAETATNGQQSKETREPVKRLKPKNSIVRSNSSLISRATPHENLAKRLNERNSQEPFAFVNNSRSFSWLDMSSSQKADQLTKIMFTKGNPLCHDINLATLTLAPKQYSHIDVIAGFSTADIMWYEPMSQKYSRLNKRGMINEYAISSIKWIPESENLFVAASFDGTLILYDKEREDAAFVAEEDAAQPAVQTFESKPAATFEILKSQKSKQQKTNPVAVFKVTRQKINAVECSPDGRFVAVAGEDGSLRIIDLLKEELSDVYWSYYGGFTCVTWSPDGRYLLTGGQDDLVCIWSFEDRSIVARCMGHRSWVSAVAFDAWRCDDTNYRFGSVGEDGRLLLWDYSASMVSGPGNSSIRPSVSSASVLPETARNASPTTTGQFVPTSHMSDDSSSDSRDDLSDEEEVSVVHFAESRAAVPTLPAVFSKVINKDGALSWLGFQESTLITADDTGRIKTFERPQ